MRYSTSKYSVTLKTGLGVAFKVIPLFDVKYLTNGLQIRP